MHSKLFCPIELRRIISSTVVAVCCVGAPTLAFADTISQSLDFRLNAATPSDVLNFASFDSGLGTLQSIDVAFDATRRDDWAVWNALPRARSILYQTSLTGTTLVIDGAQFVFANNSSGPASTPSLAAGLTSFATESAAGEAQFLAGLDPVFPSAFQVNNVVSLADVLSLPLNFDGTLTLSYDPGQWDWMGSSNVLVDSLVDVAGTVTLNYNYNVASVSDSSLGLLPGVLLLGVLRIGARRRAVSRAA